MIWAVVAAADPGARLAPGPGELTAAQAELSARLLVAESVATAVARLQGAHTTLDGKGPACDDPARAESLTRLRHFADRWHDSVQRVSVQADRARWIALAPTIAPIVDAERRAVLDGLDARARRLESQWLELHAWVQATGPRACRETALVSFGGLPEPAVLAAEERRGPIAVTAASGFVCTPTGEPLEPAGDLVLLTGRACWSEARSCGCEPVVVWPGAVLGPEPPKPAPEPVAALLAPAAAVGPVVEEAGPGEPVEEALPAPPGPE